ncbi:MAG: NAD-dependent epimerase/dehydratase family protein [Bacteroidota bacterium]|nr:NAD-dependent epimerase/dehydratase family protein [Bacteroidota bacterium]
MERILISGGAGFIGSRTTLKLLTLGYSVSIIDSLSSQIHSDQPENSFLYQSIKDKVNFIHGDVRDLSLWENTIPNHDCIIHIAAETGTGQSMYQIDKYFSVNCGGTAKMLDVLTNSKHEIKKVIVASSRAIYGEGKYHCKTHGNVFPEKRSQENLSEGKFDPVCPICQGQLTLLSTDEKSKIKPESIYGITKNTQEQMVLTSCQSLHIPAVALRYQNVYGPGQSLSNPYTGILSIFSTRILNGNGINIFEDGRESRDFVYIDDVVDANIMVVQNSLNHSSIALNVGSGVSTSVEHIARRLNDLYNSDVPLTISGDYRLGDIRHNKADIGLIQSLYGFLPKVSIEQGLANFVDWVKQQDIVTDNYENSIAELKEKGLIK